MRLFLSATLLALLTLFACSYDQLPDEEVPELCSTETITYDNQVKTIIDRTCAYAGCHDASGGAPGNYSTYAGMQNFLVPNKFKLRVIDLKNMPDENDVLAEKLLTDEEFEILECWVLQGYLEN